MLLGHAITNEVATDNLHFTVFGMQNFSAVLRCLHHWFWFTANDRWEIPDSPDYIFHPPYAVE